MILTLGYWPRSLNTEELLLPCLEPASPLWSQAQPCLSMRLEVGSNRLCFKEGEEVTKASGVQAAAPGCWLQRGSPSLGPRCIPSQLHSCACSSTFQELTWTQILGQPWSASSSAFGSGRNSLRKFYSQRQSLSSPCPTCISSRRDVSSESWGEGLEWAGGGGCLVGPESGDPLPLVFLALETSVSRPDTYL